MDSKTCFYCSEAIEPGIAKCPSCGEALGKRELARAKPTGWGSPAKPMTIAVIGWLCVVFGAFGVFGILTNVVMFIFMGSNPMFQASYGAPGSAQRTMMVVSVALGGVTCVVNLAAGIGLLRMRMWGWKLAIGLSIYAILASVIMPIFTMPIALESTKASGAPEGFVIATTAFSVVVQIVIQGLIIFFLLRPHVRAALQRAEGAAT